MFNTSPNIIAMNEIDRTNNIVSFFPIIFHKVVKVKAFVAGPIIKKINTAPGDIPILINDKANGTDAVEHIYIGILKINIDKISKKDPL